MSILYSGQLNTNQKYFNIKQLFSNHMVEILAIQDVVFQQLENKESIEKLTEDEYRIILEGNGLMIGAFVEDELIAIRALLVPQVDEHHLGKYAGLKDEELKNVIYQEISLVHPDYRGNRLQQRLADIIMKELEKAGRNFRYVCCTVAPFNIPSLKDKFNQKMNIKALEQVYGEKLRYVFIKDLKAEEELEWEETKKVSMDDIKLQQELLTEGWVGLQLEVENGNFYIQYARNSKQRC